MTETAKTLLSSAPKGQLKMWVLERYPSSEKKLIVNLAALSLDSSFIKPQVFFPEPGRTHTGSLLRASLLQIALVPKNAHWAFSLPSLSASLCLPVCSWVSGMGHLLFLRGWRLSCLSCTLGSGGLSAPPTPALSDTPLVPKDFKMTRL